MRQVNLLYRQLIVIIILWQVISCSNTSDYATKITKTTTTQTSLLSAESPGRTKNSSDLKMSSISEHLSKNLTVDGSVEGDINNATDATVNTTSNNFVFNNVTSDEKGANQEMVILTNQTSDINNNNNNSINDNTNNYTNNEDELNISSRRKWIESGRILSRFRRARGRGKNQGFDSSDRAKAQSAGKSSAISVINVKIAEKQFTIIYLTSTISIFSILLFTQKLPVLL